MGGGGPPSRHWNKSFVSVTTLPDARPSSRTAQSELFRSPESSQGESLSAYRPLPPASRDKRVSIQIFLSRFASLGPHPSKETLPAEFRRQTWRDILRLRRRLLELWTSIHPNAVP